MNPTRRLNLDRLENREVFSTGVSAGLANGVLRVVGTSGNDTIIVRQTGANSASVVANNTTRNFTGVREIYVDGQAGNDNIYVDTTPLRANEARLALKATLIGGAGNDTLVGGAAADTIYGGAGNDSIYGNGGADLIYAGDGDDLVNGGAGDDVIYGEAGNDRLFGSLGNDRIYGGAGADFIDAGAGEDFMQGGTGFDTYKNDFSRLDVLDEADPEDVRQGLSGTCVILSSLQAVTQSGVDLSAKISRIGTNQYSVPLYRPGTGWIKQTVFFDGTWTDNDPAPTSNGGAWALLYQRAYLQEKGVNWRDADANSWARKYGGDFQNVDAAFMAVTGKAQYIGSRPGGLTDADIATMRNNFNAGKPMIALTRPEGSAASADMRRVGVITSHAYSVVGFGSSNGQTTVKLRNPWGTDGPVKYGADDGIIEISASDFRKVMLGFCVS
jgi:hypothetical protein